MSSCNAAAEAHAVVGEFRNVYFRSIADMKAKRQRRRMVGETHSIRVNGEHRRVQKGLTIGQLVEEMGLAKATVERNALPLTDYARRVEDGDDCEIFEQL